jgi:hypothetical protein
MPKCGQLALRSLRADTVSMQVPRVAVALGIVLLLIGFAIGTWQPSTSVDGRSVLCTSAIDLTRLPFNDQGVGPLESAKAPSALARQDATACHKTTLPTRLITWIALIVGGLTALAGWTAIRERAAARPGSSAQSTLSV